MPYQPFKYLFNALLSKKAPHRELQNLVSATYRNPFRLITFIVSAPIRVATGRCVIHKAAGTAVPAMARSTEKLDILVVMRQAGMHIEQNTSAAGYYQQAEKCNPHTFNFIAYSCHAAKLVINRAQM